MRLVVTLLPRKRARHAMPLRGMTRWKNKSGKGLRWFKWQRGHYQKTRLRKIM